jgi:hypothetical protein
MAESRERDGWGGKYREYFNDDGEKIGESREVEGFSGRRTEYRDSNYKKTGESRTVEGFSGKRTEYRDSNYNKTGESRRWFGLSGPYTKHEGTGWFPGAQRKTKDAVSGVGGGGFYESGSSFRWAGSAVAIVAIVLVVGLLLAWGLGSMTSTNTRASNPAPRGTLAPAPRVTFSPTPPSTVRVPGSLAPRVKDDGPLPMPAQESAKYPPWERPKNESSVPTTMSGIWKGTVSQPGSSEYAVELRITGDPGIRVEYPTLACGGLLMRIEVNDDEMLLRERIEHNQQGRCISDGLVRLIAGSDGLFPYSNGQGRRVSLGFIYTDSLDRAREALRRGAGNDVRILDDAILAELGFFVRKVTPR